MSGLLPDFIRRARVIRSQFFLYKTCKTLTLSSPGTTHDRVRLLSANSVLDLLRKNTENENVTKPENIDKDVIDGLERGERITSLMTKLSSYGNIDSLGLLLLKNIPNLTNVTSEKRLNLTRDVFEGLRSFKVTIREEHYRSLIACYSNSKCFPKVGEFLSEMKNDGIQPSKELQVATSKCLSKLGKPEELTEFINNLNAEGIEISESVYSEKICSFAALGNESKASEEYNQLLTKNNISERDLQIALLRGIILNGDENQLGYKLTDFIKGDFKFTEDEICSLFDSILDGEHFHLLPLIFHVLGKDVIVDIVPSILTKLIHEKSVDKSFNLLCSLYNVKKSSSSPTLELPASLYKGFIDELVAIKHPSSDILTKCKELRKIEECHFVMEYLLHKYLMEKQIPESVEVIYALDKCGACIEQTYFWPLFVHANEHFKAEGVCQVIAIMSSVGMYPDSETLLKYVYPSFHPSNLFKYFKILSLSGRFHQFLVEVFVIYALQRGYTKECIHLLRKKPLHRDVHYYFLEEPFMTALLTQKIHPELVKLLKLLNAVDPFVVLKELWSAGEEEQMRDLLKALVAESVPGKNRNLAESLLSRPNMPDDFRHLIQALLKVTPRGKFQREREHGQSGMEVEKESMYECMEIIQHAEIHRIELEVKNMNVTGQLFRLLKYYMKVGLYGQALKIRNELLNNLGPEVQLSPSYLACMSRLYEYEKNYDEAMRYFRIVRKKYPNFVFDVPKVTGICILLIRSREFDELENVLEHLPRWWGNLSLVEHKMVGMLKGVAALGEIENTEAVFKILLRKKIIVVTENTLQPFVETYIRAGKLDEAVNEFKRLISEYGIVPSPVALLQELITTGEFEKMEGVLNATVKHYGGKRDIIISTLRLIASLGDVGLLQKYFKKYEISMLDKRLPYVLRWEYFPGEFDVRMKSFETFILAAPNLDVKRYYASFAVDHILCERNREAAEKLMHFLSEQNILDEFREKLQRIVALEIIFPVADHPKRGKPIFHEEPVS